ncbi:MAG: hypothetical protein E7325_00985 [Clostridiales bacterium]|nr:hypothetical protein [Clostridiales bacterium]
MICKKCSSEIPIETAAFCPFCGCPQKQEEIEKKARTRKTRGNGQGSAFKRGSTWTASVTVGWKLPEDPSKPRFPVKKTKGGFRTKREALEYCQKLRLQGDVRVAISLEELYKKWESFYAPRVGPSTMEGYKYAFAHFKKLHGIKIDKITSEDLQGCMDACPSGKRTLQNMKTVAGLLWKFACDKNLADRNIAENLFTGHGKSIQREPLTPQEEKRIRDAIGHERYAEYIYCLCYLGYRPGELLELRKDQVYFELLPADDEHDEIPVWFCVNGKKTDAGKDRLVVIPEEILPYIIDRLYVPGTDLVFPQYTFNRKSIPQFTGFKPMAHEYFNKHVFQPMMKRLGIAEGKTPYCARHTYADKLKGADGTDKSKAALIGHSDYMFTKSHYQSVDLRELLEVVNSMK